MNESRVAQSANWYEPQQRFAEFAAKPYCVWLDTAVGDGWSILAAEPSQILRSKGRQISILTPGKVQQIDANPFDILGVEMEKRRSTKTGNFPLGGAIGYFGYDLKNFVEKLPAKAIDDLGLPDCWFGFYDNLLVFDHRARLVYEVGTLDAEHGWSGRQPAVNHDPPQRAHGDNAADKPEATVGAASPPLWNGITPQIAAGVPRCAPPTLRSNFSREDYLAAVLRAKEYIAAGDIYQVNLSQRFQCGVAAPAPEVYATLRQASPAASCAYLDIGEVQILSSSPESFLNLTDRQVVTRPIKGTRRRGLTPEQDRLIAEELRRSPKDNAELLMITDLERNDLGRVCEYGSVQVSELVRVESYATVHHLVATVHGRLRPEVSHVDCVRACFPGGSITGAPKIRAMEIIDELEPHARGVYTGAIGCLGFNGISHLNIAIRTVVQQGGQLTFHAGGGIVSDSEPEDEYDETLAKAQGIFNALDQLRLRQRQVRS